VRPERFDPLAFHCRYNFRVNRSAPTYSFATMVREIGLAWKTLAVYPPGHQACQGATDGALRQVQALAAATGSFAVGVTKGALVAGDERLDGPHAQQLADRLRELDVAVVRFGDELQQDELEAFLLCLRRQPGIEDGDFAVRLADAGVRHVEVEAVDFSRLVATDQLDVEGLVDEADETADDGSLWERILAGQLEGTAVGGGAGAPTMASVLDLVNRYLPRDMGTGGGVGAGAGAGSEGAGGGGAEGGPGGPASAPAAEGTTVGGGAPGAPAGPGGPDATGAAAPPEIVALVERLTAAVGEHASAAVEGGKLHWIRQVGELVGALPRGLREQVLDAALVRLAAGDGSYAALGELETTAAASEMLGSLRRLRSAGRRFAPHAVDWLDALMRSGAIAGQTGAAASRQELESLLGEPEDRPALRADEPVLELPPSGGLASEPSPLLADEIGRLTPQARGQQLLTTLLELLAEAGDGDAAAAVMGRLEALFLELVQGQRLRPATALVAHLQDFAARRDDEIGAAVTAGLERLCGDDTVVVLADVLPLLSESDVEEVRALVRRFGRPMTRRLLLALGEEEDRSRRRVLFDLLASLATEVVEDARLLLADERWYVVRNMIGLLREVATADLAADLDACLDHEDSRVRIEALRALADARAHLPQVRLEALLADPEPKVTALAIRLSGQSGGGDAVAPLLAVVTPLDPLGRNRAMRVEALLALGEVGDPAVLPRIKRYFGGLAVDSAEERRAAFRSLAGYPPEARAPYVAKGLKSRDPEVRTFCRRLAREAGDG